MSRIRREKENGSENRSDKPAEVGPVCPSATQNIGARRRPSNKLGFALQLCVLRYPGRLLAPGEFVPPAVVDFIGRQLDLDGDELADYAVRSETRHEHLAELRRLYGFRSFAGGAAHELGDRLREEAPRAQSNEDLVRRFVEACRHTRTILPATTTIESAPTRWSTRNAGSKPASPSGFRPGFGATSSICSKRRSTPA